MSFTYDVTTLTGQMRLLLGDMVAATANFQDEELQAIQNFIGGMESGPLGFFGDVGAPPSSELLLLSCALAMDSLASRAASFGSGQTVQIGDYRLTGKDQVKAIQDIAQRFRDAVNNLPAWGIIEENTCGFNEMVIIRNWVLRTEM
jgi:hypothetical protein